MVFKKILWFSIFGNGGNFLCTIQSISDWSLDIRYLSSSRTVEPYLNLAAVSNYIDLLAGKKKKNMTIGINQYLVSLCGMNLFKKLSD